MSAYHSDHRRALIRTYDLAQLLLARPRTLTELAATLGVCVRTIRRDIDTLQNVGFRVVRVDEGDQVGQWRCLPSRWVDRLMSARQVGGTVVTGDVHVVGQDARRAS